MTPIQQHFISMAATVLMLQIPYVCRVLKTFSTLVHEFGHALCNMILSVKVIRIELRFDTSGLTYFQSSKKSVRFLTSLSGYSAPSALAYVMALLIASGYEIFVIIGSVSLIALNALLFIRNAYGLVWAFLFAGSLSVLFYMQWLPDSVMASFLLSILLYDGLASAIGHFRLTLQAKVPVCDATVLRDVTYIPAWFWSFLFVIANAVLTYLAIETLVQSAYFGSWILTHWPTV